MIGKRSRGSARQNVYELRATPERRDWAGGLLRAARTLLLTSSLLYVFSFVGWRVLLLLPVGERVWPLALSAVFVSWSYVPLLVLALLALLLWDRRSLWVLLIPLFVFSAEYGRQFLPNWNLALQTVQTARLEAWSPNAVQDPTRLRVMTWNMLYTRDSEGVFQAEVRALQPDLVALQEVDWSTGRNLPEWFRDEYPFQQVLNAGGSASVALLSRYPILDIPPSDPFLMACSCQQLTLDVNGQPVTVINAHPTRPTIQFRERAGLPVPVDFESRYHDTLLELLIERVASIEGALLVVGDLNTSESQANFHRLRRHLDDSFAEAGWGMGYTYPSSTVRRGTITPFPLVRIDHILHSPHWQAVRAWTAPLQGSDHQYVVADLVLRE